MLKDFTTRLWDFLVKGKQKNRLVIVAVFSAIIAPVMLIAGFSYMRTYRDLTDATLSRRQAISYLAATALKGNLDRLTDIGISLATRVRFRKLIKEGKWDEAVQILRTVPGDFPFIERLFLSSPDGTLTADTPQLPGVKGRNFAFRDWYRGVSRQWTPYISQVYKRTAEPRLNVVAAAIPIKAEDQKILGVLVLQVRLDTLFEWTKGIDVGPEGLSYFVDRQGHVAAHPTLSLQEDIVDHSAVAAVEKALRGERGVEIASDAVEKGERITAYEPVPEYGWGVITQQPKRTAFVARDSHLRRLLTAYGLIALLAAVLAYLVLRTLIERKRIEEALKGSEERFRGMAEAASDAIISADSGGNITYCNHAAEGMFGYAAAEVMGQPLTELMPDRFRESHKQGLERFLSTGEARVIGKTVELVGKRRDGSELPLELSLSTWKTNEGIFFTGILRDTTERKRFEAEILDRNKQIEAANKELEAFSYSVSHDLRAPLRAVDGFSRILLEDYSQELSGDAKRYLQMVRDNTVNMGQLIDDLLTFSRLSRQSVNKQLVMPAELARQVLQDLRYEQDNRRVEISIDDLPPCRADPALLRQVFVNLISNAIKFTRSRETPKINVGYRKSNGETVYFVEDNGVGFDMRYADKLFGVFQRLHRAEEYEGTGVGLAIVQRITHRHGGRAWAEAEVDRGATFYFTFGGENADGR